MFACRVSRKLAVASWSYSCFRKGRGRSESNTVIFNSNPPKLPGHFEAVLEADGHEIPSCFQAHMNLSFRSPPLGPQVSHLTGCPTSISVQLGSVAGRLRDHNGSEASAAWQHCPASILTSNAGLLRAMGFKKKYLRHQKIHI